MKLNGWKRLGILASIIWIIVAFFHTFQVAEDRDIEVAVAIARSCEAVPHADSKKCTNEMYASGARTLPFEREEAAIIALVPVPLAWFGVYLIIFLVKWVRRGF
jgi:hypothetical protein